MTSLTRRDFVAAAEAGVLRAESVANSHDGEKTAMATTASFHSTPVLSPTGSPPHAHHSSTIGRHSLKSSSSQFSVGSRKISPSPPPENNFQKLVRFTKNRLVHRFSKKPTGSPDLNRFTYISGKIIKSNRYEFRFPVEPVRPTGSVRF
ncbi:Formin-like protein [Actinidia chinensis var. chinensis]|uniref:Formin-like protein n=1 Tax=Actinidia chinensis var. chinensis TaxID=1590841 RepID=A0A2R6QSP4_ACTCC|nr:Formin-like protein [Actinidia chinensis var. chinensis]